uniref:Uncharacterized protein n=1 Tax=Salix viminalis TaxID=40686 RepID=A0A6N2LI70_SALVM
MFIKEITKDSQKFHHGNAFVLQKADNHSNLLIALTFEQILKTSGYQISSESKSIAIMKFSVSLFVISSIHIPIA